MESESFQPPMLNQLSKIVSVAVLTVMSVIAQAQSAPADKDSDSGSTSTQSAPQLISVASRSGEDATAESLLLQLANQRRKEAGVPPLHAEEGLMQAARIHA